MKKFTKSLIAGTLALACCGAFALAGCGSSDDSTDDPVEETKTYTITFDYNYSGSTSTTQTVEEGSTVTKPSDPTRDGYTFDDWYTTSSCTSGSEVDFTAEIYANATYYAGWTEEAAAVTEYTVTFVISDSTSTTQTVVSGETVTVPDDPENGNYIFSGWYSDEACTTSYDFSAEITEDTTIYAGWIVVGDDEVAIIYMWNYDDMGVYKVETQEANKMVTSLASATREGYYLKGWYTDEECTTQYVTNSGRLNSNLTLYALWYKGYTFEAEYTNFNDDYDEPRQFFGYSENILGEDAISADSSASNGYYVGAMYVSGAYIYFEIESDAAVSDAVLCLRLAMGYGYGSYITLTSDEYLVSVNGTVLSYSTLTLDCPSTISEITSFMDYTIGNISLVEGTNVIRLEVNNANKGEGGSQWAKAPYVDCIKIYSSSTLTWDPITSNI